jgi:Cu(I)/Ag(I) efflux system membrane protein CusA/SilA
MAIILLAFVPVFALTGQEGQAFHPLAFTKTFAVLAATSSPSRWSRSVSRCCLAARSTRKSETRHAAAARHLPAGARERLSPSACYDPVRRSCLRRARSGTRIGSEFMPPLNEGDLMFMPIADPSISLEENTQIAKRRTSV